jgi:hypothetical protein
MPRHESPCREASAQFGEDHGVRQLQREFHKSPYEAT